MLWFNTETSGGKRYLASKGMRKNTSGSTPTYQWLPLSPSDYLLISRAPEIGQTLHWDFSTLLNGSFVKVCSDGAQSEFLRRQLCIYIVKSRKWTHFWVARIESRATLKCLNASGKFAFVPRLFEANSGGNGVEIRKHREGSGGMSRREKWSSWSTRRSVRGAHYPHGVGGCASCRSARS